MTSALQLTLPGGRPETGSESAAQLTPDQQRVVNLGAGCGPVLVLGAPGTGKSTVLVESAVRRITEDGLDPAGVLLLAPTRLAAARLRDELTARADRSLSAAPARTWASYAFDLIRRARIYGRLPDMKRPPRLLSGAEQDLILKELLVGHGTEGASRPPWPDSLSLALPTRGFRQEVRQLFDRVSEYGVSADELEDWGRRFGHQEWVASAGLYREYRDVLDLRMPEAFDPAGILTAARQLFESDRELLEEERRRLELILVDDYQEANTAVHALLGLLGRAKDTIVASCPDTVVQGFRGARPELTGQLEDVLGGGSGCVTAVLTSSFRMPGAIAAAYGNVVSRISVAGGTTSHRRLDPLPSLRTGKTSVHILESEFHELRYIAQRVLEAQMLGGRRLEDIAVLVRTGGQVAGIQRYLAGHGISVNVPASERAIRDEPAVRPLLELFGVALGERELDAELAVSLLTSRIGGAGPLEIRRLRQLLRRRELGEGGGRNSDDLLVEALTGPLLAGIPPRDSVSARRIAAMISAGREVLADPAATPETVLWSLWSASGWAARWAAEAVSEGPASVRADRDLDALVALFQTAERFVEQMPGAPPARFLEYLTSQELPMDTLAPRARKQDSVTVMTPAGAAGRQWPMVIVAGVQEGIWPDLRLRGELLGSGELSALLDHGPDFRHTRTPLSRMHEIRFDELRSFSTAISRASEELICCAVSSDDAQPSRFLDLVDPLPAGVLERPHTAVQRPLTMRSLVAELRRYAQQPEDHPELAREAVHHLGTMVNHSPAVPGAHPAHWWGIQGLSSTAPVVQPGQPIPVSPSKMEAVLKSPLDWFVSAAGGEPATDFARSLGTLVHGIAQDMPGATGSEYVAELAKRWPALSMKDNWEGRVDLRRAETMVRKLARYVVAMRQAGRSLVATEVDFTVDLPVRVDNAERVARLRGSIDRLEIDAEGRLYVVDLKTGGSSPAADDLERHPQLAAYQIAAGSAAVAGQVQEGVAPGQTVSGGAALVQIGTKSKNPGIQEQPALKPTDDWAGAMVEQAAALMSAARFDAVHDPRRTGPGGSGCRLPEICPLCAEGRQVTE